MISRALALSLFALLLAGCNQETVAHARYQCDGGHVVNASFVNGEYVDVTYEEMTYRIPRVEAASGAKYEVAEDGRLFWSKGIDALFVLTKGTPTLKCRRGT